MTTTSPRIVFAGTPAFAASHLSALIEGGFNIVSVYSQPDRPAGRGKKLQPTPVKAVALAHDIAVEQPARLDCPETLATLAAYRPDVMVVVAYGLLLRPEVLALPTHGCINVHASLLPRWRGAAPIERALMAGDRESGISLMQMDAGLDTGPVLSRTTTAIAPADNSQTLGERLCELGCRALCQAMGDLPALLQGAEAQDEALATYARKITKAESAIDWQLPAGTLHDRIRALYPRAPAYTIVDGKRLRLLRSAVQATACEQAPGTVREVSASHVDIVCGEGCLRVFELQLEGKGRMTVQDLLNGHAGLLEPGRQLGGS